MSTCSASSDFFVIWNWWYGPSKTKNDQNASKRLFSLDPQKHVEFFAYIF